MTGKEPLVIWEDPPGDAREAPGIWAAKFAAVMERPGQWAVLYEGNNPHQKRNAIMRYRSRPAGHWEFTASSKNTSAKGQSQSGKVYARYLGPETNGSHR